jgi:hypothetical protein
VAAQLVASRVVLSSTELVSVLPMGSSSAVGIATGYRLDDQEVTVRVPGWSRMFTSPYRNDRLWGPHSLLSNVHRRGIAAGA